MTPRQRRVHLAVWLLIGPLLILAVILAATSITQLSPARDWPKEVRP